MRQLAMFLVTSGRGWIPQLIQIQSGPDGQVLTIFEIDTAAALGANLRRQQEFRAIGSMKSER